MEEKLLIMIVQTPLLHSAHPVTEALPPLPAYHLVSPVFNQSRGKGQALSLPMSVLLSKCHLYNS